MQSVCPVLLAIFGYQVKGRPWGFIWFVEQTKICEAYFQLSIAAYLEMQSARALRRLLKGWQNFDHPEQLRSKFGRGLSLWHKNEKDSGIPWQNQSAVISPHSFCLIRWAWTGARTGTGTGTRTFPSTVTVGFALFTGIFSSFSGKKTRKIAPSHSRNQPCWHNDGRNRKAE